MPETLFTKIYFDNMRMPEVHGLNSIIAARDNLSRASEVRAVKGGNASNAADFLLE